MQKLENAVLFNYIKWIDVKVEIHSTSKCDVASDATPLLAHLPPNDMLARETVFVGMVKDGGRGEGET